MPVPRAQVGWGGADTCPLGGALRTHGNGHAGVGKGDSGFEDKPQGGR